MKLGYGENFFPGNKDSKISQPQNNAGGGGGGEKIPAYTKNRVKTTPEDNQEFPEILSTEKVKKNVREEMPEYFKTLVNYRGREAKMFLGMEPALFKIYQTKNPDLDHEFYDESDGRLKRVLLKHIRLE